MEPGTSTTTSSNNNSNSSSNSSSSSSRSVPAVDDYKESFSLPLFKGLTLSKDQTDKIKGIFAKESSHVEYKHVDSLLPDTKYCAMHAEAAAPDSLTHGYDGPVNVRDVLSDEKVTEPVLLKASQTSG